MPKTEAGIFNPDCGISAIGLEGLGEVRYNLGTSELCEAAIRQGEAHLTACLLYTSRCV